MSHLSGTDDERAPLGRARAATTELEYVVALDELRQTAGRSFKQISETAGSDRLPRSTAHHLVRKKTLPVRKEQVVLFVTGCGEPADRADLWAAEWERLVVATKAARSAPGETTVVVEPVTVPEAAEASAPDVGSPPPGGRPPGRAARLGHVLAGQWKDLARAGRPLLVLLLLAQLLFTVAAVYVLS